MPTQQRSPTAKRIAAALVAAGLALCASALAQPADQAGQLPSQPPSTTATPQTPPSWRWRNCSSCGTRTPNCEHALQALIPIEARLSEAEAELTAARATIAQLNQQRQTDARHHTAQLNAADQRLREHKDRLLGFEVRINALEAELQARDAEIAVLTTRLDTSNQNESRLNQRVATLRGRLTATEGGTLTAADARKQAETDAERLDHLVQQGQGVNNPELWRQVREAENALHHSQFVLARADSARTVYRVRPGDTLAQVGLMFYGDAEQWSQIYDANRHVIADPNRLLPGLSLVIP